MTPAAVTRGTQVLRAAVPLLVTLLLLAGVMLGVGELLTHHAGAVGRRDVAIERWLAAHRSGPLDTATKYATYLAEAVPVAVLGTLAVIIAAASTRRWRPPLTILLAIAGEKIVYLVVGTIVMRPRPPVPRLGAADPNASFPSGHTGSAVTLYGSIALVLIAAGAPALWRRAAVLLALLVPVIVAFCRMDRGFHHLTDVVAGAVIGLVWLLVVARVLLRPYRREQASHRERDQLRHDPAADWLHEGDGGQRAERPAGARRGGDARA